jgi:nitroreductase
MDERQANDPLASVERAITSRRSVRGFKPDPIARATVERILEVASRAPSMTNSQPWRVRVVTGPARDRLCAALTAAFDAGQESGPGYAYYPREWREPYLARRRAIGWALYGLLGIEKGDRERTHRQHARNYAFFGAPVGMIFTLNDMLGLGSWLDLGMFMENVMVAARGHGLDTCPQAAFASFADVTRRELAIPPDEIVVCGMALGYADPEEKANALVSSREPVAAFASFHET